MAHVSKNKRPLMSRVRRLKGQVEALEKALDAEVDCVELLTQVSAVRGAAQGLMVEVLGEHLREHVVGPADEATRQAEMTQVLSVLKSYLR